MLPKGTFRYRIDKEVDRALERKMPKGRISKAIVTFFMDLDKIRRKLYEKK